MSQRRVVAAQLVLACAGKAPDVARALVLGDSFTFGFGVDDAARYPARLEHMLAASCAGTRVEVINTGVSAFGTSQALAVLERYGLRYEPDVIMLGSFINDPEDNLDKGVHVLEDGRLVETPPGERREAHARTGPAKQIVNAIPGYQWMTRRWALVNLLRQTYFRAQAVGAPAAPVRTARYWRRLRADVGVRGDAHIGNGGNGLGRRPRRDERQRHGRAAWLGRYPAGGLGQRCRRCRWVRAGTRCAPRFA